jgi:medium-chain acyl-[acyl-carrier-protein] hydrolase
MRAVTLSHNTVESGRRGREVRLRLFCFPYAGRGASIFRTWNHHLPPAVELYPVQSPGRETRLAEPPFVRLTPLVERLSETLTPYFDVPFAFFGHSMGALVSFELARYLRKQGRPGPIQLFVSGHRAPQLPRSRPPLHDLPESALLRALRELKGASEQVLQNRELLDLLLPTLRADLAVCENYQYRPEDAFDCPIAAFGGLEDSAVSREDHAAWIAQTRCSFSLHMFPGDHFFLHSAKEGLLSALFQQLQTLLCVEGAGQLAHDAGLSAAGWTGSNSRSLKC